MSRPRMFSDQDLAAMEASGEPELAKTAARYRKYLERTRAYANTPKRRESLRSYAQREDVKARKREYMRSYFDSPERAERRKLLCVAREEARARGVATEVVLRELGLQP